MPPVISPMAGVAVKTQSKPDISAPLAICAGGMLIL